MKRLFPVVAVGRHRSDSPGRGFGEGRDDRPRPQTVGAAPGLFNRLSALLPRMLC
jgi:hypothetical protein